MIEISLTSSYILLNTNPSKSLNSSSFDENEAIENLKKLEKKGAEEQEKNRLLVLKNVVAAVKDYFADTPVQVFVIGSLIQPGKFRSDSDVDLVLKNFSGDRFDVWTFLEGQIARKVEVILYENCSFKDHIDKFGLRIHNG